MRDAKIFLIEVCGGGDVAVYPYDPHKGCPEYSLEITGQGAVTFEGKWGVWMLGKHSHSIPVLGVRDLLSAFDRAKFFGLQDEYLDGLSAHGSGYSLSLTITGRTKSVFSYHNPGNPDAAPEVVKTLVQRVVEVSGVQRYLTEEAGPRTTSPPSRQE